MHRRARRRPGRLQLSHQLQLLGAVRGGGCGGQRHADGRAAAAHCPQRVAPAVLIRLIKSVLFCNPQGRRSSRGSSGAWCVLHHLRTARATPVARGPRAGGAGDALELLLHASELVVGDLDCRFPVQVECRHLGGLLVGHVLHLVRHRLSDRATHTGRGQGVSVTPGFRARSSSPRGGGQTRHTNTTHPQRISRPLSRVLRLPGLHPQLGLDICQLRLGDFPEAQDFVLARRVGGCTRQGWQVNTPCLRASPALSSHRGAQQLVCTAPRCCVAPSPAAHSCAAARQQTPCPGPPSASPPAGWRQQLPGPPLHPAWWATWRARTWAVCPSAVARVSPQRGGDHLHAPCHRAWTAIVRHYTALLPSTCLLPRRMPGSRRQPAQQLLLPPPVGRPARAQPPCPQTRAPGAASTRWRCRSWALRRHHPLRGSHIRPTPQGAP